MKKSYVLAFCAAVFLATTPRDTLALTITVAEISLDINNEHIGTKDIKPHITDGQRYDFDFSDFFPIFSKGRATGFVFADEGLDFALLEKGLRLENTVLVLPPGTQVDIGLFVQATWFNPGGVTTQEIFINGVLQANAAFSRTDVTALQSIDPFIGALATQDNLSPIQPGFQQKNVNNGIGPAVQVRPPEVEVFKDSISLGSRLPINAGLGDFTIANFSNTTLERASVATPEPNVSALASVLVLGLFVKRKLQDRCPPA